MSVDYEIAQGDLKAFNYYHHFHSPTARRHYFRSWSIPAVVLLLVFTGIWYLADSQRHTPVQTFIDLWPLFAGVPLYIVYFPWAYRRKVKKIISGMISEGNNRGQLGWHQLEISADKIIESSVFGQTSTVWSAVERVVQSEEHAFIYVNALAAIIVPRRAFKTATEFAEFVQKTSNFLENAPGLQQRTRRINP